MCIAAIDIVLLALRWLWYEQYITAGGAVLQVGRAGQRRVGGGVGGSEDCAAGAEVALSGLLRWLAPGCAALLNKLPRVPLHARRSRPTDCCSPLWLALVPLPLPLQAF